MLNNGKKIKTLFIKPFLGCDSNCPTCASRQDLYRKIKSEATLSLADWYRVLEEGRALGAKKLIISGGEPMLYGHLVELIARAKSLGYRIKMNTSGGMVSEKKAEELVAAGLDGVMISLLSSQASRHDKMKNNEGLWKRAGESLGIFRRLKDKFPDFSLRTQFYVTKDNYQEIGEILKLHYDLGSDIVSINYLEWDFRDRKNLLSEDDIKKVRSEIIPEMMAFNERSTKKFAAYNRIGIRNFYNERINRAENFSRGQYSESAPCSLPAASLIVLANGNVLPCCTAEYVHGPVLGNVLVGSLREAADSGQRMEFKKYGYSKYKDNYCNFCPMPLSFCLNFRECAENRYLLTSPLKVYLYSLMNKLSPALSAFIKEARDRFLG